MKTLFITEDGTVQTFDDVPFLSELGSGAPIRASHVLPASRGMRIAFLLLRRVVGERGSIAEWSRGWSGPWTVRWAATPDKVEFEHPSRKVCIQWERMQLNNKLSGN